MTTKWSPERKWLLSALGLVLLLLGAASYASYQNATRLILSANQVRHTNQVLNALTDVVGTLTDAEAGRRGYFLFGAQEELERYDSAIESIKPKITRLQQLVVNDANQQQRLIRLNALIGQRLMLYQRSNELLKISNPTSAQAALLAQLRQNQREIRQVVGEIQTEEERLLERQVNQSQSGFEYRMLIEVFGPLLTLVMLLSVFALLYRQMVKRQQAESLQRQLRQEKELGELKLNFFSMVSHEFRTPLSVILGSVQLLENSQLVNPKKLKNLHRIESSARLMTKLLTDILTLTRAEAGKLECKPKRMDLESFCLNLVEDIQFSTEPSRSIELLNQEECTHACLDEQLLYSILSNLLANAIKYSTPDKTVCLTFSCESNLVIFKVKDQGIGISSEDLQSLFEPFYRSETVKSVAGSGLGLAVVKTCLDLHRGQISVESEVGVGTIFTVIIPQGTNQKWPL
ncbi:CHASE3 domain-containing protein [Phormidium tenue FACHB-886]|nr:CHASE3 domain-containing protein [Phormidium tenue FACHB-886]